jgi:hypothetical protein
VGPIPCFEAIGAIVIRPDGTRRLTRDPLAGLGEDAVTDED